MKSSTDDSIEELAKRQITEASEEKSGKQLIPSITDKSPCNWQPVWSKTIDPNAVVPSQGSILERRGCRIISSSRPKFLIPHSPTFSQPFIVFLGEFDDWAKLPALPIILSKCILTPSSKKPPKPNTSIERQRGYVATNTST